jgi:hypothetical protein
MPYLGNNAAIKSGVYKNLYVPTFTTIPLDDITAYTHFKSYRWVYDKMRVAELQGLACGPLGIIPEKFPIFLKPIYNLFGGSISAYKIDNEEMYERHQNYHPGRFWMEFLEGKHLQHDISMLKGKVVHAERFEGHKYFLDGKHTGAFDYWDRITDTSEWRYDWLESHLQEYTGSVNAETIHEHMIEIHLRPGLVVDMENVGMMNALIKLYGGKKWDLPPGPVREFYMFNIFGDKNTMYVSPTEGKIESQMEKFDIMNYGIEMYRSKRTPPLIQRVGWITSQNYQAGIDARNMVVKKFKPAIPKKMRDGLTP